MKLLRIMMSGARLGERVLLADSWSNSLFFLVPCERLAVRALPAFSATRPFGPHTLQLQLNCRAAPCCCQAGGPVCVRGLLQLPAACPSSRVRTKESSTHKLLAHERARLL